MNTVRQKSKADAFLKLHQDPKLLVLPNIWDPLGARMLQDMGYPAVATASAAVAYSLGYDDGEKISFSMLLDVIKRISAAVDVPLTADIERGYAETPEQLSENIGRVIKAGAVGINLEDSRFEGGPLYPLAAQCERIAAAREAADTLDVHLVINARTDIFLGGFDGSNEEKLREACRRASAYGEAGADCFYPVLFNDLDGLAKIQAEAGLPLNVFAMANTPPMKTLEAQGISRLSLGPGLIKASLTTMRQIAATLLDYGPFDTFTAGMISNHEIAAIVSKDKMSGD